MKTWQWLALGFLTLSSLVAEFTAPYDAEHAAHWWSAIPAFYILYGFVGCVVIIFFSKALGKLFLQQSEEYYDE
jgi:hypothetical protein